MAKRVAKKVKLDAYDEDDRKFAAQKMEHPGDWHSQEGPLAKRCSQLAYRLISLADKSGKKKLGFHEARLLGYIDSDLRAIGG